MSTLTERQAVRYMDAIREGIADEMRQDDAVCLLGIDVGPSGGIFAVTRGLYEEFGPDRIRDPHLWRKHQPELLRRLRDRRRSQG